MRVLLMVKTTDLGGAESHVCDLATELTGLGHEVWVLAARGRRDHTMPAAVRRVAFRYVSPVGGWQARWSARLVRRERIELIHAHQHLPVAIACQVGSLTGVPVVATLHERYPDFMGPAFVRETVARLIVIAPHWRELIRQDDPALFAKTVCIPNGVRLPSSNPAGRHDGEFRLLYASRLNRSHAAVVLMLIDEVLPAMLFAHPQLVLHIAGDGSYRRRVARHADRLNRRVGREVVRMLGYRDDLAPTVAAADVVMGVGRVAIESLAAGVPVASVNGAFLGDVIGQANYETAAANNFVARTSPPPTVERLTAVLGKVVARHAFWRQESAALRSRVATEFGLAEVTAQTVRVYEAVLRAASPTRR